jgi:hypothetical protein
MMDKSINNPVWRTSSYSGPDGGNCVEVCRDADGTILIRDTKQHGHGSVHRYPAAAWRTFVRSVRDS